MPFLQKQEVYGNGISTDRSKRINGGKGMNYAELKIGKLVQTVLKPLIISKAKGKS